MATSRAALIDAQREAETRQNNLKVLISDDYASLHDISLLPDEPLQANKQFFNLQDSWGRGLNQRPDLLQTKLDLEQAGIQLKYYRNQVFPQLDAFGSYGYGAGGANTVEFNDVFRDFTDRNQPAYTYGVKFSIPLGNITARNRYKSGKATVQQAVLTLKKTEQNVMVQIDEAIKTAKSAFEKVTATREAREFAEAALEAEQKKLENGKSTSFEVLSLQSQLTAAASAEIRALADYNEALTALAQQEGSTLDRRNIDVRAD
jgi:outer membrane protein TolC